MKRGLTRLGAVAVAAALAACGPASPRASEARTQSAPEGALVPIFQAKELTLTAVGGGILVRVRGRPDHAFVNDAGVVSLHAGPLFPQLSATDDDLREVWGVFPHDLFGLAYLGKERTFSFVRVRAGVATKEGSYHQVLGVMPAGDGRMVGIAKDGSGWKRIVWTGDAREVLPLPRYATRVRHATGTVFDRPTENACVEQEMDPFDAMALAGGEILVVGVACTKRPGEDERTVVIDRWTDAGAAHELEIVATVPGGSLQVEPRLCAPSDGGLHVAVQSRGALTVISRRGNAWLASDPLQGAAAGPCSVAADGSVWVASGATAYRLSSAGEWTKAALAKDDGPWCWLRNVATTADGAVWAHSDQVCGGIEPRIGDRLLRAGSPPQQAREALRSFEKALAAPVPAERSTAVPSPSEAPR